MSAFASVAELEKHLSTRSYVTGYALSEDDKKELRALSGIPCPSAHPNVYRWAIHIVALTGIFVGAAAAPAAASSAAKPAAAPAPAKKAAADDDDDLDLFGDEEEEAAPAPAPKAASVYEDIDESLSAEEQAAARARRERMEAARKLKEEKDAKEGKKKKEKELEKSLVVLEVKPWEADTDLEAVWREIIKYEQQGLTWGQTFKLEPVAYGIKKLVLTATIIDSLVVLDDITENIEAMEDYVQSVEIASMNKL